MPKKKAKTQASSWHSIKQTSAGRAVTKIARKRRAFLGLRTLGIAAAVVLLLGGLAAGIHFLNTKTEKLNRVGAVEPLRNIYFETDGVLTQAWLLERIDLPEDIALADVDIRALQEQLLSEGQTRSVTVEKRFPDALLVSLKERTPLLRLVIVDASGRRGLRLVAGDGHVYHGSHYPVSDLQHLPFLDVAKVERAGNGYADIPGMETVGELLGLARSDYPELYAQWKIVSCRDFGGDADELGATITVTTHEKELITFAPADFERQLSRLQRILAYAEENHVRQIRRIDLSYEEPIVKLAQVNRRSPHRR